jgi:hypothetical protein
MQLQTLGLLHLLVLQHSSSSSRCSFMAGAATSAGAAGM